MGGLTKCGVRSSAASFACLPSSGASRFAQHEAALGNFLKRYHLPALQLALEREKGWTGLGAWKAHRGAVWEIAESVSANSAHPAVIFKWEAGRREGGLEVHLPQSHSWAKVLGSQDKEAGR